MRLSEILSYTELPNTRGNWAPYIVRHSDDVFNVFQQGHKIASARLGHDRKHIVDLSVNPEHQGRGIASALYKHIEGVLGYPLEPSPVFQTPDGKDFWKSR
jgi:ribosomal protein S18 acetylase RimI-like enzyme